MVLCAWVETENAATEAMAKARIDGENRESGMGNPCREDGVSTHLDVSMRLLVTGINSRSEKDIGERD